VGSRLAWMVDSFRDNEKKSTPELQDLPNGQDELDTLHASFLQLNRYVRSARRGDTLQPNFIGRYAVGNPVTGGVMSWIYRGINSETQEDVLLKIPHNNLYVNPLYRACLQTELQIMQSCNHRN